MSQALTRRQQEIYRYLQENLGDFPYPPSLDELCSALGMRSKGSLHKQIQALVEAGLVLPMNQQRRGVRLSDSAESDAVDDNALPFLGFIAAGRPIEAVTQAESVEVPGFLRTPRPCFVLEVRGDSMIEEGILDGDRIVVEQRQTARDGEIVVALIDGEGATLKRIEQRPEAVILHPANAALAPMRLRPEQVTIQGVLVGQMRRYLQ